MPKKRTFAILLAAATAFAVLGGRAHPFGEPLGEPEPVERPGPFLVGAKAIDPKTLHLLERSCQDCHSSRTVWPWYGRLAPGSWLLERDVVLAQERFNFSRWDSYTPEQRTVFLSAIGAAVRTGEMPPERYLLLHPDAKLSPEDRLKIYDWTKIERQQGHR